MNFQRFIIYVLVIGLTWRGMASAQSLSAATGPQQMIPNGAPEGYPSTYPTTSTPTTSSVVPPYDKLPPLRMAAVPGQNSESGGPALGGGLDQTALPGGQDSTTELPVFSAMPYEEHSLTSAEPWTWQILPTGLMYKSYLAGNREPRLAFQWVHERNLGWLWDATLGARVGLVRYGTENDFWPQGWQLDVEGAAFPRLNCENGRDVDGTDFRVGVPLTTRQGPWEFKFGYYHLSSHIGDEYLLRNPGFPRINYVRESLLSGLAVYPHPNVRLYSEVGYAFYIDGGALPWEFQFGADISPVEPSGPGGAPFFAVNGHLRQENDFGGNFTIQTGWQWRGRSGHLLRLGMQYFNGMSEQYQFYRTFEEQIGMAVWYDF